ncbi:MAG: LuxR C-terminal-related transcriptional regulator [Novosphingobium sp.]|uniref:helix-turn-helix transcriptional regulator n=1 Tax=Novosphingobium sp. TaxID=1874826 RepID=UPI0032BE0998
MLLTSIARLRQAKDSAAFKLAVVDISKASGFGACFIISPVARNTWQGRVLDNFGFDERWAKAYRKGLYRIDPLPEIALAHGLPFRLGEAGKLLKLNKSEQRYLAILDRGGASDAIAFPTFGSGARTAIICFGHHPNPQQLTDMIVLELHVQLQAAYHEFCRILSHETALENELSIREKDVLYWLTQGKSNSAIAQILEISAGTVDTYLRRVFQKMNVTERVGAAMAAVRYGYVIPGEFPRPG